MSFRRYEILLPIRYNDGRPIEPEKFLTTYEEVVSRFGGVTIQPETLRGIWLHEDQRFEESNVRVVVDVEDSAASAAFFAQWKERLKERFRQIDIWIVSYEIRIT